MYQNNVRELELEAAEKIKDSEFDKAEALLKKNYYRNTKSADTYRLLIKIYKNKGNYNKIITVLNKAIKYAEENKKEFKELKKTLILNKLITDIFKN